MKRWLRTSMVFAIGLGWAGTPAGAQTVERESSVTGPGGRTIKRDVTTQRGPGFVDRNVQIQRPGGTFDRNTMIQRGPGFVDRSVNIQRPGGASLSRETMIQRGPVFGPPGPGRGFPSGGFRGFGPRTIVEQPVIVGGGGGGIGLVPALVGGAGLFGLGMLTQSALSPPPPPPVVVAAPAPNVVYNAPQPYQPGTAPAQPAPTLVVDPVLEAGTKLQSYHENVRKEGVIELGRYRDARAVPALVDRLKNDSSRHVRAAAATALGEIGDPRAAVFLERATEYDRRQEVRDAAKLAYMKLPSSVPSDPSAAQASAPANAAPSATASVPNLQPAEQVPPPPQPAPVPRN
ncbi:MAG: HEAT repeat domain-containing protein [Isosphaeraceae bacterium]|nr:HEAT repeat domain-containing protein [Isosphaeraceae bacterium]